MRRQHHGAGQSVDPPTITPYEPRHRLAVRDLAFHSYRIHSHLDWQDTDQFLDSASDGIRLAWAGGRLVGLMGVSAPLAGTCWVRLAGVADDTQPLPILRALWDNLAPTLRARGVTTVALLILRSWIAHHAAELGFQYVDDIVTLRRTAQPLPELPEPPVVIRATEPDDIAPIAGIDQAAFAPPWQLTLTEVRQAERASALCTVALLDGRMVGYQLSTLYFDGAHLARLAVAPEAQGKAVATALLADLIARLNRRGVGAITVNTQASNERSQRLYRRFGFSRNGYDMPVWMAQPGAEGEA